MKVSKHAKSFIAKHDGTDYPLLYCKGAISNKKIIHNEKAVVYAKYDNNQNARILAFIIIQYNRVTKKIYTDEGLMKAWSELESFLS